MFFLFILHIIGSYGDENEIYIDSSYSGLDSDGTLQSPLNDIDIVQKYINNGKFQQFIVENTLSIGKPLVIENMTITLR